MVREGHGDNGVKSLHTHRGGCVGRTSFRWEEPQKAGRKQGKERRWWEPGRRMVVGSRLVAVATVKVVAGKNPCVGRSQGRWGSNQWEG